MKMSSTPPLPSTLPPEHKIEIDEATSKEKWILNNEDIEVTQFLPSENLQRPEDLEPSEIASGWRLQADLEVISANDNNLLKPAHVPKRRRSPVTVQEWVASLPIPHLLEVNQGNAAEQRREKIPVPVISLPGSNLESPPSESSLKIVDEHQAIDSQENINSLQIDDETYGGFRRLSATFEELEEKANASEDTEEEIKSRETSIARSDINDDKIQPNQMAEEMEDSIKLGEEAGLFFHHQPSFMNKEDQSYSLPKSLALLAARRRLLIQSHEQHTSFQSDFSAKTVSSVDSVLMSRNVDPAEFLMDLGFGGRSTSVLARIPTRFFTKSHAKGISVESFLRTQAELMEKFDSGFSGYRGLSGPPNSRPSKLVEKIIDRIRIQERLRRQVTGLSLTGTGNKMVRLKTPGFANVVNQAMARKPAPGALKGASAFRAAVHSVLSPANREYMDEQKRRADRLATARIKKKLVLGNKTFSIDEDDLSVVDEKPVFKPVPEGLPPIDDLRQIGKLSKRDSEMSMISSCSVESDWSDEELEELEKMFGSIQHKSSMKQTTENLGQESSNLEESGASEVDSESLSKWRQLSRRIAMLKLQQQQKRNSRESFVSTSSLTNSSEISSTDLEPSELIFTRDHRGNQLPSQPLQPPRPPSSASEQEFLASLATQLSPHQFAKEDERVPRRFSQQQNRILR